MLERLFFWLKISRPGLWFATLWLYLLPTSGMAIGQSWIFWLGLFYVTFPLNFLVYGWNDVVDRSIDLHNPRKDSYWFGARGTEAQLQHLWKAIAIVQLIFFPLFIGLAGIKMFFLLMGLVAINALYNLPEKGLRSNPPWEVLCQIGYLLIVPFSSFLNDCPPLPWQTYLYLLLFAFQSHLIGEVMDIEPDRKSGRKTTATVLGIKKTKLIIIGIVAGEIALLLFVFQTYIFGGLLVGALVWLLLDLFVIYKTKTYTLGQMKLFGLLSNILAVASMAYVWYSACLLSIP